MKYLLPLLVLLAVNHVQANLGETILQIEARYGGEEEMATAGLSKLPPAWTSHYTHGDYKITVYYCLWKSASEAFIRKDGKDFTNDEIQKILAADNQKSKWGEIISFGSPVKYPVREWMLDNKKTVAVYDSKTKTLTVETEEMKKAADVKAGEALKQSESP